MDYRLMLGGFGFLKPVQIRLQSRSSELAQAKLTAFSRRRFIFSPQHNLSRFEILEFPCLNYSSSELGKKIYLDLST